jgi:putative endonuclease
LPWYVYIASNKKHILYIGITPDPIRRLREHVTGKYAHAFTRRYNYDRIVYYEPQLNEAAAKKREKQLKGWKRAKKLTLIEASNPEWKNLVEIGTLLALEKKGK